MNAPLPHKLNRTRSQSVVDTIVCQLDPDEMAGLSAALQSIDFAERGLCDPRAMPRSAKFQGTAAADNVVAGEVIAIFADANPHRGYDAGIVWQRDILAIPQPPSVTPHRNPRASAISRRIGQGLLAQGAARPSVEQRQRALVELAAAILDQADRSRLKALTGCVPVVAIVGDTRAAGLTSGRFYLPRRHDAAGHVARHLRADRAGLNAKRRPRAAGPPRRVFFNCLAPGQGAKRKSPHAEPE